MKNATLPDVSDISLNGERSDQLIGSAANLQYRQSVITGGPFIPSHAAGYAITEPPLVHLRHLFKIGNVYGIFGGNEQSGYILSGEDRLLDNWESVMIYRPQSKQGKRGLTASVAGSDDLSTNSPLLPIIDPAPGRPLRPAVTSKHGLRISLPGSSIVRCDWEEGLHAMLPSWHGST